MSASAPTPPTVDLSSSRYERRDGAAYFDQRVRLSPDWALSDAARDARETWLAVNAAAAAPKRALREAKTALRDARKAQEVGSGTTADVDAALLARQEAEAALDAHSREALSALRTFDRIAQESALSRADYARAATAAHADAVQALDQLRAALLKRETAYALAGFHVGSVPRDPDSGRPLLPSHPGVHWASDKAPGISATIELHGTLERAQRLVDGFPDELIVSEITTEQASRLIQQERARA